LKPISSGVEQNITTKRASDIRIHNAASNAGTGSKPRLNRFLAATSDRSWPGARR
jgi:hypothetical protein